MRYRDAGVDLSKHERLHEVATGILGGVQGYYNRWVRLDGDVALHVDGVGTKALWLLEAGRYDVIGWDCLYVNVNDLVCDGFKPIAAVDYIAVEPGLEDVVPHVLEGLSEASRRAGVVVLGGETAIMPGVVRGVDIACSVLGVKEVNPASVVPGDYVVGLESTGPHANGYSLLRKIFRLNDEVCGKPASEVLLSPVADYTAILRLMKNSLIKAAAHITGGSFRKAKRVLGRLGARLRLGEVPCWVKEVVKRGVPLDEAYRVFNMGIGMLVFTDSPEEVMRELNDLGIRGRVLGRVTEDGPLIVDDMTIYPP